jgi:hypothetical protein
MYLLEPLAFLEMNASARGMMTPTSMTAPPRRYLLKPVAGHSVCWLSPGVKGNIVVVQRMTEYPLGASTDSRVRVLPSIDRVRSEASYRA